MANLIKNNLPRIFGIGKPACKEPVLLKPGVNSVSDEDLMAIEDNPHFMAALERSDLELLSPKVARPEVGDEIEPPDGPEVIEEDCFDIASVNVGEAEGIIRDTFDVELLRSWGDDDRSTVKRAIRQQLERIGNAGDEEQEG